MEENLITDATLVLEKDIEDCFKSATLRCWKSILK